MISLLDYSKLKLISLGWRSQKKVMIKNCSYEVWPNEEISVEDDHCYCSYPSCWMRILLHPFNLRFTSSLASTFSFSGFYLFSSSICLKAGAIILNIFCLKGLPIPLLYNAKNLKMLSSFPLIFRCSGILSSISSSLSSTDHWGHSKGSSLMNW